MEVKAYVPAEVVEEEITGLVARAFPRYVEDVASLLTIDRPPRGRGDFAVKLFRMAGRMGERPRRLAERLEESLQPLLRASAYVERVEAAGEYLNFWARLPSYGELVYRIARALGDSYGHVPTAAEERIIIEHTSANPIHPLHVGHLRNCLLGDSLARLLRARGHEVRTHFYIDDTGLQVAYAAYGYSKVREMEGDTKPDHFIGLVYSMTNAIVSIIDLERRVKEAEERGEPTAELNSKLSEWLWTAKELRERDPDLFDALASRIREDDDPLGGIYEINRMYDRGELWAVKLVRSMVEECLKGFRETLDRLDIHFDSWDWESEITTWSGSVDRILEELGKTGLVYREGGALVFAADKLASYEDVREDLGVPPSYPVQPLVLTRSDGTALYTTKDIAYSLWKFRRADKVINVIGVEQALAQLQLRLALYAMGSRREAKNMVYYSYEMVNVPGFKMSSRRGRYVAIDDLLDNVVARALEEIEGRDLPAGEKREIAEKVGVGAIKYFFLSVSPNKVLTFDWDKIMDFSQNSGPFVEYAYVRARSVLRRAREGGLGNARFRPGELGEEERRLVVMIGDFPKVSARAADDLRPDLVAGFLNNLALEFNKYYDSVPILRASTREKVETRLELVKLVAQTFKNAMRLLGFEPPERM